MRPIITKSEEEAERANQSCRGNHAAVGQEIAKDNPKD